METKKSQGQETCSCTSCLPRPCLGHRRRNRGRIHPLSSSTDPPSLLPPSCSVLRQFLTFSLSLPRLFLLNYAELTRMSPITRPVDRCVGVKHSDAPRFSDGHLRHSRKKSPRREKARTDRGKMCKGTFPLLQFTY